MQRAGTAPSNFTQHVAAADSELAQQGAKDPYAFEFLGLSGEVAERDLEQALMDRIVETLREMGPGSAFVGRQVHREVDGDDFYIDDSDLLFFHVEQLRYFVIEPKTGKFQPEFAGKLNFYVALVDDKLRREAHAPTVGILICGSKNDHTVRYAFGRSTSPMAVAAYTYDQLTIADRALVPAEEQFTAAFDALPDDRKNFFTPESSKSTCRVWFICTSGGGPRTGGEDGQISETVKGCALQGGGKTRLEFLEQACKVQGWIHTRQGLEEFVS